MKNKKTTPLKILLPISFSTTQPLPGVTLDIQSILRDLLNRNLPPSTIREVTK